MAPAFDPAAHSALATLGGRLRELAGDPAYQAGRDYLRKGLVQHAAVAATTAYATVTGSTTYRVSVAFRDDLKVTCTCPAHRRNKYCKHVVAVCAGLLERPADFTVSEAPPPAPPPAPRRRRAPSVSAGKQQSSVASAPRAAQAALRASGLETVDRLLVELAEGGLAGLGPDKLALLASAGELVRALKLRRLGNLVLALQRGAGGSDGPAGRAPRRQNLEPAAFAALLVDLYLTRRATGAHLDAQTALDPRLAEDLLGKTWRSEELEAIAGLELVEVGHERHDDGEFWIQTTYLADLASGTLYAETQITPLGRRAPEPPPHGERLLVADGGLYPGDPPRRLRLRQAERAPLAAAHVDALLGQATDTLPELRRRLVALLQTPFGPAEVAVLFRPSGLVHLDGRFGALDGEGRYLALDWPDDWTDDLRGLLPPPGQYALAGLLTLGEECLRLRCLAVVSASLRWGVGPIYPDAAWNRRALQRGRPTAGPKAPAAAPDRTGEAAGSLAAAADRLRQVEERLARLLVSGWRHASAEAAAFGTEADALAALELPALAERLRAVANATGAQDALAAIALACSACRLLRARLPTDAVPAGAWLPLGAPEQQRANPAEHLIPLARMAVADGEAWACVRLHGGAAAEWLLVTPPPSEPDRVETAPRFAGLAALLRRSGATDAADAATPGGAEPRVPGDSRPWLRRPLQGRLRWQALYPLGASGQVRHCWLEAPRWPAATAAGEVPLQRFRQTLADAKLEDDQALFAGGGALRVKELDAAAVDSYVWPAPATRAAFQAAARGRVWVLAWCAEGLIAPLAILIPGGFLRPPRLVHLVPGCPTDELRV